MLERKSFASIECVKLLNEASLYYFIMNQTDRSSFYREMSVKMLSEVKFIDQKSANSSIKTYQLPLSNEQKESMLHLLEPPLLVPSDVSLSDESKEKLAKVYKDEGNNHFKANEYDLAIEAYMKGVGVCVSQNTKHQHSA